MSRGGVRNRKVTDLTLDERLALAREKTDRLVDHVRSIFPLHETNRLVIYSPAVASRIPKTLAGNTFGHLQQSLLFAEVVRLMALWDEYGENRDSIPTVIRLIDHPEVFAQLVAEERQYHLDAKYSDLSPSNDPEIEALKAEWWRGECRERSEEEVAKLVQRLEKAKSLATAALASDEMSSLKRFRDRFVAHNLVVTEASDERRARYGDERKILEIAQQSVDLLYLSLKGTGFLWDDAKDDAKTNAEEFWLNVRFDSPDEGVE